MVFRLMIERRTHQSQQTMRTNSVPKSESSAPATSGRLMPG